MGVRGQRHALAVLTPGNNRYPLNRRLGGPQDLSGRVRKISPLPGFDPRTVQPISSRYTGWAIPAHTYIKFRGCLHAGRVAWAQFLKRTPPTQRCD